MWLLIVIDPTLTNTSLGLSETWLQPLSLLTSYGHLAFCFVSNFRCLGDSNYSAIHSLRHATCFVLALGSTLGRKIHTHTQSIHHIWVAHNRRRFWHYELEFEVEPVAWSPPTDRALSNVYAFETINHLSSSFVRLVFFFSLLRFCFKPRRLCGLVVFSGICVFVSFQLVHDLLWFCMLIALSRW